MAAPWHGERLGAVVRLDGPDPLPVDSRLRAEVRPAPSFRLTRRSGIVCKLFDGHSVTPVLSIVRRPLFSDTLSLVRTSSLGACVHFKAVMKPASLRSDERLAACAARRKERGEGGGRRSEGPLARTLCVWSKVAQRTIDIFVGSNFQAGQNESSRAASHRRRHGAASHYHILSPGPGNYSHRK